MEQSVSVSAEMEVDEARTMLRAESSSCYAYDRCEDANESGDVVIMSRCLPNRKTKNRRPVVEERGRMPTRSSSSRASARSVSSCWMDMITAALLLVLLVAGTCSNVVSAAATTSSNNNNLEEESQQLPFLETKPPLATRTSLLSGLEWNELLLLKKSKDLTGKLMNRKSKPQPQQPTKATETTTTTTEGSDTDIDRTTESQRSLQQQQGRPRGNVRRRTRSYRGKEVNRALRKQHHHHKQHHNKPHHHGNPHQYRAAPHHRDGHNGAMAEKEPEEEEDGTNENGEMKMEFPMGEEHTTMPQMVGEESPEEQEEAEDYDDHPMMQGNGHGDGLDHHHHKHHHKQQHHHPNHHKHQHMHDHEPKQHPGQARHHYPKASKKSKGAVKYQNDLSYGTPTTTSDAPHEGDHYHAEEEDADYGDYYYKYPKGSKKSKSKSKSKTKSGSKSGQRGKRGKRQYYSEDSGDHGAAYGGGELQTFEASLLLEMQDHYVMELSYLDLQQLESVVMETYNALSVYGCDAQGRELTSVTMDPTPTATGYILHMQGQCYGGDGGCDPTKGVELFAHDDKGLDQDMMTPMKPDPNRPSMTRPPEGEEFTQPPTEDMMMTGNGTDTGAGGTAGGDTPATDGSGGTTPGTDANVNGTTMAGMMDGAGAGTGGGATDANATTMGMDTTAPAPANRTVYGGEKGGRNRGGTPSGGTTAASTTSTSGVLNSPNYGSYGSNGFPASGFLSSSNGLMGSTLPGTSNVYSSSQEVGQGSAASNLLPKKTKTFSKQRSRLVKSEDDKPKDLDDALPDFSYGTTAESRAAYHHNEEQQQQNGRRRELHQHHHRNHHHHNQHQHMHQLDSMDEGPTVNQAAINRGPETDTHGYGEEVLQEEDRHMHLAARDNAGLVNTYKYSKSKKSKGYGSKGSKKSKGKGYSSSSDGPVRYCSNPNPTHDAPTEQQFVSALNEVTDELLAQYNKLSVRTAIQVKPEPCSETEEEFESSMVVLFMGPSSGTSPPSLTPAEMQIAEQAIMHSYNHLQATHSCDVPHFREVTDVLLRGTAPGPMPDSFLVMFDMEGTCRGHGCSDDATFFDPHDDDDERRRRSLRGLMGHIRMPQNGFTGRSGHVHADSHDDDHHHHIYHEQCYCPYHVDEFGPPFATDMLHVFDSILRDAFNSGLIDAIVSVEDIMEVTHSGDDEVAHDDLSSTKEDVDSFIIIQFFGQRDAVQKEEVDEIARSIPIIYKNLQDMYHCDSKMRVIESAELMTVDPGPTEDSFLLGFALSGQCDGSGCSDPAMYFAPSSQAYVSCGEGTNKWEGPPIIEDFENDLYNVVLQLQGTGDLMYITISGDAVEVLPGATPAPIFSSDSSSGTSVPQPAPPPKTFTGRTAGGGDLNKPTSSSESSEDVAKQPSAHPTYWPTWLDTNYPTYRVDVERKWGQWGGY